MKFTKSGWVVEDDLQANLLIGNDLLSSTRRASVTSATLSNSTSSTASRSILTYRTERSPASERSPAVKR